MASPPLTPTHRRRPSSISIGSAHSVRSARLSLSRRSSAAYSPTNSRRTSSHGAGDNLADELGESLADELGGWDEEAEDGEEDDDHAAEDAAILQPHNGMTEQERDSGIDVGDSSPHHEPLQGNETPNLEGSLLSPDAPIQRTKKGRYHQRTQSSYDGSEYGSESDLEVTSLISASLEARLAAIEAMARRGMEENGSHQDRAVARFTESLRDLGGQMGVEQGATRLTTAYSSVATHLGYQARLVAQLTSSLLSPLAPSLEAEYIEEVIPLVDATLSALADILPTRALKASVDLHHLSSSTADLVQSLSYLSDTLHVNRQTTTVAARRLKQVKDVLGEWKREEREREEGVRWIERGGWDGRLKGRECARECRRVVEGFENVLGGWRERVVQGAVG